MLFAIPNLYHKLPEVWSVHKTYEFSSFCKMQLDSQIVHTIKKKNSLECNILLTSYNQLGIVDNQSKIWASLMAQVLKESACNVRDSGSISGSRRSPGEENGYPLQYSCLGNPMDRVAFQATWGHKESDTTE